MPLHLRADDGIRTRDPNLGKVVRYQLRHIRALRARTSPVAKHDDSPPERDRTNSLTPLARRCGNSDRTFCPPLRVLIFVLVRLSAPVS
jgi:hypothetical protein